MWRLRHNHHVESYLHEISNRRSRVKRTKPSVKLPMSFAKLKALASTDLNLPTLWCTRLLCSNITKSNEEIFVLICIVLPLSCVNHTNTITYLSLYETLWLCCNDFQKQNIRKWILAIKYWRMILFVWHLPQWRRLFQLKKTLHAMFSQWVIGYTMWSHNQYS